jgi:hypothetical protein
VVLALGRTRVRRTDLLVLTMNPIIIHLYDGEVAGVECAGDLPPIVFVDHLPQADLKKAPSAVDSPEGLVLITIAGPGHAEKPSDEWREWAENLF